MALWGPGGVGHVKVPIRGRLNFDNEMRLLYYMFRPHQVIVRCWSRFYRMGQHHWFYLLQIPTFENDSIWSKHITSQYLVQFINNNWNLSIQIVAVPVKTAMWSKVNLTWEWEPSQNFCFVYHGRFARWIKWRGCDIEEAKEGLENELWRRWSNRRVGEWAVT